jgi:hypothetical protein
MQINPKPVKAKIEMRVSAGESITQKISISNITDKVWNVDCKLRTGNLKNSHWFSGDNDITIQPSEVGYCEIDFTPQWMDQA